MKNDSKTVQCKCGKQVKLDKIYYIKNLETHASGSGCLFQNGTNKGQFSILNFVKRPLEIDENTPLQISPISCQGLSDDKYLDYILLIPTQYGGGKRDIVAYNLFSNMFSERKGFSRNKLTPEEKIIWRHELLLTFKWRIDKDLKAIFSMNCERKIQHPNALTQSGVFSRIWNNNGISNSVLSSDQTKVSTYEDIHVTMKLIRKNNAVANQIKGFILKIPISKIPPVIIAAILTKGNTKADEISQLLLDIIDMTARAGINLLSISANGAMK
ncbi:hypothetical protein C1646_814042 [Rhizophagus diaphanus]|nr:hypothetical protein C1646_814042 [Rhizophagus diaphanus] [Rhizophagus sp. MUCL 43196]